MFGGALPGCRTRRRHLLSVARVRLLMYCGGIVLRAVRALHCRRSDTRHAENAEDQHHNASDVAQSKSDCGAHPKTHRGSIAGPVLPRNNASPRLMPDSHPRVRGRLAQGQGMTRRAPRRPGGQATALGRVKRRSGRDAKEAGCCRGGQSGWADGAISCPRPRGSAASRDT